MDKRAGLISENILEDILNRVDIVELISSYIPLKRSGRNFKANCPFHQEKTPSFMVSVDKQIYHCFGCGAGGNAFNFLMQHERLEFPEAVEILAEKTGVTLPKKPETQVSSLSMLLYKLNEQAALFYENNLSSASGSAAKNYLLKRGVREETIKALKLGYALDKWDGLINYLRVKNINLGLLEKAGLILNKEEGGYYDRFRNRIIFPVQDIKSRIVAFGARVLDNSLPKYLNSPETAIYVKGKNLYGLNLAKDAIRETDFAVVVEGYLDFIMPYQEGLHNIIASLGTALTTDQIRLLKRYTANVVMVYDGDTAGQLATLRALDILIEEGMNVKIASLPANLDPDTFVRKNGIQGFRDLLNQAENLFDYKLKMLKSRYSSKEIEGKAKICSEILPTINKLKDSILKSEYIKKLAQELKVEHDALMQELKKIKVNSAFVYSPKQEVKKNPEVNPTEKLLIKMMLEENELIHRIKDQLIPEDFQDKRISRIVAIMFELVNQGKQVEIKRLVNSLEDTDISKIVCESSFLPAIATEYRDKVIDDCICRLKAKQKNLKKEHLHNQIKSAQASGDHETLEKLTEEFHCLIKGKGR